MPSESPPALLDDVFARAWAALYGDDPAAAAAALRAAACLAPECGEAWATLGELASPSGRSRLCGRAVVCDPSQRRWRLAWGDALLTSSPAEAEAVFALCVGERSDDDGARLGLARALVRLDRAEEALTHYREAAALTGGDAEAVRELASLYIACGDPLAAAEALSPLVGAHAPDAAALVISADAWLALGDREKALKALAQAEALGDKDAGERRARLESGHSGPPPPPDAAYVRALFDRYAERFDAELVERLDYRGPQLVGEAVSRALPGAQALRTLDLGCGTGLAGEVLRPLASALHGVDLSPAMVAQARKRRVYDGLTVGTLEDALRAQPAAWDLLTAADVLMYVGDLRETFSAAAEALAPGGAIVFTVEEMTPEEYAEAGADEPFLRESRRYAHGEDYVRRELARAGLRVVDMFRAALRMDRRQPVTGLVFAAARLD